MKNIKKFSDINEGFFNPTEEDLDKWNNKAEKWIVNSFKTLGLTVSEDGEITTSKKFGKLLCEMGVIDGHLVKEGDNKYKLKN